MNNFLCGLRMSRYQSPIYIKANTGRGNSAKRRAYTQGPWGPQQHLGYDLGKDSSAWTKSMSQFALSYIRPGIFQNKGKETKTGVSVVHSNPLQIVFMKHETLNGYVLILTKFALLVTPEIVILTASGASSDANFASSDANFVKMTFPFQCMHLHVLIISRY